MSNAVFGFVQYEPPTLIEMTRLCYANSGSCKSAVPVEHSCTEISNLLLERLLALTIEKLIT